MSEQDGFPKPERRMPPQPQTPPSYSTGQGRRDGGAGWGYPAAGGNPASDYGNSGGMPPRPPFSAPQPGASQPGNPQQGKSGKRRKHGTGTLFGAMLLAGVLGGGTAVGADALLDAQRPAEAPASAAAETVIVNDENKVNAISAAAKKASPSVVTIAVAGQESSGTGSGIILDAEGHILTNTHVVTLGGQAADPQIEVRTNDGRVHSATVVGTDPFSDLAVIKIEADGLSPATLADANELNVGDTAIAIGAPLGLSGTVTDGIISTLNRTIRVASSAVPEEQPDAPSGPQRGTPDDEGWNFAPPDGSQSEQNSNQGAVYINVIQTDAAINHGNSGGALVNAEGEVTGVNVAIASGGESGGNIGVGFSIPINYAERVAKEIIANGAASHGFLGVSVTPKASEQSTGPTIFSVGAEVAEVVEDSPAAAAGLRQGDVITQLGNAPIGDGQALTAAVRQQAEGATVALSFLRNGQLQTTEVTLGDADLT